MNWPNYPELVFTKQVLQILRNCNSQSRLHILPTNKELRNLISFCRGIGFSLVCLTVKAKRKCLKTTVPVYIYEGLSCKEKKEIYTVLSIRFDKIFFFPREYQLRRTGTEKKSAKSVSFQFRLIFVFSPALCGKSMLAGRLAAVGRSGQVTSEPSIQLHTNCRPSQCQHTEVNRFECAYLKRTI
jgi:hypothetical protein